MKKLIYLLPTIALLCSCGREAAPVKYADRADYGCFLGRSDNNVSHFSEYKYVAFEFDEFTDTNIKRITEKGTECFAYLSVGSLENYRDYYDEYSHLTFKDYDDWPDECWIEVFDPSWQSFVINDLAKGFKDRNAAGVYLDNVDVYSVAKEEGLDYEIFGLGLKNIIKGISELGLKVMMNGGAEFIDDMNDQNDNVFNYIWAYHQEEVFSLITDYENNRFGKQDSDDKKYYQDMSQIMKNKGKEVFYLEYTTDPALKNTIKSYCAEKGYHYYISSTVGLL